MSASEVSATAIRRIVLEQSHRAHVGHIGSCLSVADLLAALYGRVLRIPAPDDPARDRFILSKGHAALALYAALYLRGWLSAAELDTFCGDGSLLGVHPDHAIRGVDLSTGSLGIGLSAGAGMALAARLDASPRRVFVLISDAECNEGSVWETVMFAAHHRLSNLVAIVDLNGQQALGATSDILSLEPLIEKWRAFGWQTAEVDGHDVSAIAGAIESMDPSEAAGPRVVMARTVFGKGVPFMEGKLRWHYFPMSDDEYREAMAGLEEDT